MNVLPVPSDSGYPFVVGRRAGTIRDHVYVEPGTSSRLLLGSITFESPGGTTIFELGESNRLNFRILGTDVLLLGLAMATTSGHEILSVIDGHVRFAAAPPVEYRRTQGHVRVTAPASDDYVPAWALQRLRTHDPDFAADGIITLLDLEVVEPGLVRVQGLWSRADQAVAITPTALTFLQPQMAGPLSMVGHGTGTVIHVAAPITSATFGFGEAADSVLKIPTPTPPKVGRNDPCWCGSGLKFKKCHGQ